MDASISRRERKRISRLARSVPGVQGISFLKTRRIGQKVWADVGIVVPSSITLAQGDTIAQEVQNTLLRNFIQMQDSVVYLEADGSRSKRRRLFGNVPALFGKMRSIGSRLSDPCHRWQLPIPNPPVPVRSDR